MSGANCNHALIVTNLVRHLSQKLNEHPCTVCSSNLRVRVPRTGLYTHPDVVVTCDEKQFVDEFNDTLLNPVLVIEMLSDSTKD